MGPLSPTKRRHILGIITLLSVVVMWLSSSFLMNSIFGDLHYEKPFLVTYLCTSSFAGYLLPYLFLRSMHKRRPRIHGAYERITDPQTEVEDARRHSEENAPKVGEPAVHPLSFRVDAENVTTTFPIEVQPTELPPLTARQTANEALKFCLLWFAANYCSNGALQYTNVSSFTIISSMSGFFTLFMGVSVGVERFTWLKLGALLISIAGVTIVSLQDSEASVTTPKSGGSLLLGDFISLLGAAFYGFYTTLVKLRIHHESRVDMPLFFGFVGLFCLLLLWPFIFILSAIGIEPFALPSSSSITIFVVINMAITFISDYLWILAMLMTSPLIVTMGLSLSIPLALLGDFLFKGHLKGLIYWLGAILVLIGFSVVNLNRDDAPLSAREIEHSEDQE